MTAEERYKNACYVVANQDDYDERDVWDAIKFADAYKLAYNQALEDKKEIIKFLKDIANPSNLFVRSIEIRDNANTLISKLLKQ
jgi:hypothetical protein